jgi:hypothetical protein
MRVNGRILRPATLAERRFLLTLGTSAVRVPRRQNPYVIARRVSRAAHGTSPDILVVREMVQRMANRTPPTPSPDVDTAEPIDPIGASDDGAV